MKVSVHRKHIDHAVCGAARNCMIAVAIREADPTITYVAVRTNGITISRKRKTGTSVREHWAVPLKAARALVAFDAHEIVRPFTFEAKLIDRHNIPARPPQRANKDRLAAEANKKKRKLAGLPTEDHTHRFKHRIAGL